MKDKYIEDIIGEITIDDIKKASSKNNTHKEYGWSGGKTLHVKRKTFFTDYSKRTITTRRTSIKTINKNHKK